MTQHPTPDGRIAHLELVDGSVIGVDFDAEKFYFDGVEQNTHMDFSSSLLQLADVLCDTDGDQVAS